MKNAGNIEEADLVPAEDCLRRLLASTDNESTRTRLSMLHATCKGYVVPTPRTLTVPAVIEQYGVQHPDGPKLSESSIRNRRGGVNPYRELYQVWEALAALILRRRAAKKRHFTAEEIVGPDDLSRIDDLDMRRRVLMTVAENRSLRSEIQTLRKSRDAPVIYVVGDKDTDVPALPARLTEVEVNALRDFLDEGNLKARGLVRLKNGVLGRPNESRISTLRFTDAIEKVLAEYEA